MNKTYFSALCAATLVAAAACGSNRRAEVSAPSEGSVAAATTPELVPAEIVPHEIGLQSSQIRPEATVFRMSGDYAMNVPVDIYPEGKLFSYPAPSDVTADSAPIPLADGWWLDRRGVGEHTVFTRWTYSEYHDLKEYPTPREISAAVIPGAKVTAVLHLDMTVDEALADTAAVNAAIASLVPHR